ncbi:cell division protein ZapE [Candidatus Pelagibacter sp.]|nr:cell division protein ZapE [Candidatus Pelagibacter sp.]
MSKNLEEKFISFCNSKNLEINQNQIETIKLLQGFYNKNFYSSIFNLFKKENYKKGFYLYGGVGVGKTMILDFFYDLITAKKLRLHFNEFMLNFHDFVHENKNKEDENIINLFVKDLKSKALLIYFDEFQVTNIVDAMILGKLFDKIFSENIKIIVTSNIQISDLYKDGLQRDQFKPFIEIMKKKTLEHELVIEDDYRKSKENQNDRYFSPLNQESNFKMNKFFRIISKDRKKTTQSLDIKGREFLIKEFYQGVVRFTFDELCDKNLGAEDYLEIAKVSKFIVIDKIPKFDDINSNQQHRFITLVDIVYDKKIPIAVTAEKNLDELTSSKSLKEPFNRTISRLYELTSSNFNL